MCGINKNKEIISDQWTLFLDRDGVINERIPGAYISRILDFEFKEGIFSSLSNVPDVINRIIIITNQQGIAKGIMNEEELNVIHDYMLEKLNDSGIRIDRIYTCTDSSNKILSCRKPSPEMGLRAKMDFPTIVFGKSIMIGDSISDMEFADCFGMKKILFLGKNEEKEVLRKMEIDICVNSWDEIDFARIIK